MKVEKRLIKKDHPDYQEIVNYIQSSESVVGIDAKHTHVVIIKKLMELEEKLDKIQKQLAAKPVKKKVRK